MNITPEESAALERLRRVKNGETVKNVYGDLVSVELETDRQYLFHRCISRYGEDKNSVLPVMLRIFPVRKIGDVVIRWDDPVTPERLLACGWALGNIRTFRKISCGFHSIKTISDGSSTWWWVGERLSPEHEPRHMLDIWNLMERVGVEIPGEVM